jgi:hypothetical protein
MNEEIKNLILELKEHLESIAQGESIHKESSNSMVEEINATLKYYS